MTNPLSSKSFTDVGGSSRDVLAPVVQVSKVFPYQSYCNSALYQRAIAQQFNNDLIVKATATQIQQAGFAVGLAPWSETPIAIKFDVGATAPASGVQVIKPGQVVRPTGGRNGGFSAFTWGIPFGWLGGGSATLFIFKTPDADIAWPGNPEVLFHQFRYKILANNAALPATPTYNFPLRFPWLNAVQGSTSLAQGGKPTFTIEPTRVTMRLRTTGLAAGANMRAILRGATNLDVGADGLTAGTTDKSYVDISWPQDPAVGANAVAAFPLIELTGGPLIRLGADAGGVDFVDVSGGSLANVEVDVMRWGRL